MADTKLTALTNIVPTRDDYTYTVDNPTVTPVSGYAKWSDVLPGPVITVAASDSSADAKRHAHYVCDGVADNVEIQAAIDAASAAGGGTVRLSSGTYAVAATIALKNKARLLGIGRRSVLNDSVGNLTILSLSDCADGVVESLAFTGTGVLGTAGRGAIWADTGISTSAIRCKILNNYIDSVGTCGISLANASECIIQGNHIRQTAEHGIYLSTGCVDIAVVGNQIIDAGRFGGVSTVEGIKIVGSRITFTGNIVENALADGVLFENGAANCTLTGNIIRSCGGIGVRFNAGCSEIVVNSNQVINQTSYGIRAIGGDKLAIIGNVVVNAGASCINVASGCTSVQVSDNYLVQSGGFYAVDLTATRALVDGNFERDTGADGGIVIRATSTAVVVRNNTSVGAVTNSAGAGAKVVVDAANYAAATVLGALSSKVELFDSGGASLGFVPVYASIT